MSDTPAHTNVPATAGRFDQRIDAYAAHRPGYPPEVITCLREEFGLRSDHVVADVASGTGLFTRLLLEHGNPVFGVEPNAGMRRVAEQEFSSVPGFTSVLGRAEATGLDDERVDFITAAQAFHWFDVDACRTEFLRILRPGGQVALIWNNRRLDSPFLRDYESLIRSLAVDYEAVDHTRAQHDGRIPRFFGDVNVTRRTFDNLQRLDLRGLTGRTVSASYMPGPDHPAFSDMITTLERVFSDHAVDGLVDLRYETVLYVGRLKPGRS